MRPPRYVTVAAIGAALAWTALVFTFGGLHFDDFLSIDESYGAFSLSPEQFLQLADDGRWQPLKRATFDFLFRTAGMTFWPYALALAAAHMLMAAGTASIARAIWPHDSGRLAGLLALASLSFSAYSLATVGTLHGILSVALAVWAVAEALRGRSGRHARLAFSALFTVAACLTKESAVTAPALAAYGLWLAAREGPPARAEIVRAVAAPALGVAMYFALRLALGIALIPPRSRYTAGDPSAVFMNAMMVSALVMPWALAASIGWGRAAASRARILIADIAVLLAATVAALLPSLLLPWQSPNFWYAAAPVAALGAAGIVRRAAHPSRSFAALAALIAAALAAGAGAAWRSEAYRWGPYSEASIRDWKAFPRHGGRVVWFDADSWARYEGLARTIGPGERLAVALRLATGDRSIDAEVCISIPVAPPYEPRPDDELFLHTAGRIEPLSAPPPGAWYCLPWERPSETQ